MLIMRFMFTMLGVFTLTTAALPAGIAFAQFDDAGIINAYGDCRGGGGFVPLECFNQSPKLQDAYNTTELGPFLQKLFVGAISLGAILAVLRLAWAGFVYMSSDLWSKKESSKEIIKDTLLGLFLLLAIYLILNQINPDILSLEVDPGEPARLPAEETGNPFF